MADEPRPSVLPRWATTGDAASPSGGKLNVGWVAGEAPPHDWFNFIIKNPSDWIRYLDAVANHVVPVITRNGQALDTSLAFGDPGQLFRALQFMLEELAVSNWTERVSTGNNVLRVAHNGTNLFAVGGDNGSMQTSPDGITWTNRTMVTSTDAVFAMAWGASVFVAMGEAGLIETSPDGITWSTRTPAGGYSNSFRGVAWNGTVFAAVGGASGEIQTSTDGITWTARTADGAYAGGFRGIAWNGAVFVAVGDSGEIQTSPDGTTWTARTAAGSYSDAFRSVAWNGSVFVAVGDSTEIQTSPDGTTWTAGTAAGSFSGDFLVASSIGNGAVVIAGQTAGYQVSYGECVTWIDKSAHARPATVSDIFAAGEQTILVGGDGSDIFTALVLG